MLTFKIAEHKLSGGEKIVMKHAMNVTDIKRQNQRLILESIFESKTTSRTQLSHMLSLSKPAISDNLEKLLTLGVVTEAGEGITGPSGGRKSIILQFNPTHRYIIAVNLNFSNPVFAVSDLSGNFVNSFDISIPDSLSIKDCMSLIINSIRIMIQALGSKADQVYCIAVAAPGTFDKEGNLIGYNPQCGGPAWWNVDLKEEIHSALQLPVIIYNDVKAATIGEWIGGAGNMHRNFFYLSVGLGLGSGLILNGKPFLGENFNAGEIFDCIDPYGASVGLRIEDTTCINYLKEQCMRLKDPPFPSPDHLTLSDIITAYNQGHPEVCAIVGQICERLANIAYNFMCFLSVNHVVFGGEYAPFFKNFSYHLRKLYQETNRPTPTILCTQFGKYAGIQGMITKARRRYFDEICYS